MGEPSGVRFVEDKRADFDFVREALEASSAHNQWTNFGPVSERLEATLAELLGLPEGRRVVMCASGTSALFALAALKQHRAGRPLRWVTSAFGFHPARQGPFRGARLVDCDARGMLDLAQLIDLDRDSYDAVLVTNVFGGAESLGPYARFCRARGKILVCDAAPALDAPYRQQPDVPDEIVSFHHTKPWGMGEGGCAIVDEDDEDAFRSLINFGIYRKQNTGGISNNGKMSDIAAAFILDRLRHFPEWRVGYHRQYARIAELGRRAGFVPLLGGKTLGRMATPSNVPLLAPRSLPEETLADATLPLLKYYRPLGEGHPTAWRLYRRMVNVPCHPGLAAVGSPMILRALQSLAGDRSRPFEPRPAIPAVETR